MGEQTTILISILFLLCLCSSGCGSLYTDRFQFRHKPDGQMINTSFGTVHVATHGTGPIPALFIHGNLGTHLDFTMSPLAPLLQDEFTVYALDRPGAGFSTRASAEQMTLEDHADTAYEVIEHLGLNKPLVIGHSYGGGVSLMLSLRHPESISSLLLISPAAHDWEGAGVSEYRAFTTPILGPLLRETVLVPAGYLVSRSAYEAVFSPNNVPEDYYERSHKFSMLPSQFKSSALDMQVVRPGLAYVAEHYADIKVPVAVLSGDRDTITPYWNHGKRLHQALPLGRVHVIPNGGHQLHFSHPEAVRTSVCWLNEQTDAFALKEFCGDKVDQ